MRVPLPWVCTPSSFVWPPHTNHCSKIKKGLKNWILNVAWPRDFPSFETKFYHLYSEILLNRKVKLNEKCKEISWFEKPASAFLIALLTHFFGRTFDPRRETPGIGWWHRGKVWFGVPFPEEISETTHRYYQSDLKNPCLLLASEFEKVCFDT